MVSTEMPHGALMMPSAIVDNSFSGFPDIAVECEEELTNQLVEISRRVPAQPDLYAELGRLTAALVTLRGYSAGRDELGRFEATFSRGIDLRRDPARALHAGRTVLVTGGTGCIGSSLLRELATLGPARLVSISRGRTTQWPRIPGVQYVHLDVRDRTGLRQLFARLRPDLVYHLAAQHDPGLAEVETSRTLSTNLLGVRNVLEACQRFPDSRMIFSSTGKALRPFSPDVYAASKKVAEYALAQAALQRGALVSAVRFTHVVDNSILHRRLRRWTELGDPIRLHNVHTMFYLQSALEAAQLLIASAVDAVPGRWAVSAIRDLDWPASLLDLALGVLARTGSTSPIHVCGAEPGYEPHPYPALYDPIASGGASPMFSALEVTDVRPSTAAADVDVFDSDRRADLGTSALIDELETALRTDAALEDESDLLQDCSWSIVASALRAATAPNLQRHARMVARIPEHLFVGDHHTVRAAVFAELNSRCPAGSGRSTGGVTDEEVPA